MDEEWPPREWFMAIRCWWDHVASQGEDGMPEEVGPQPEAPHERSG